MGFKANEGLMFNKDNAEDFARLRNINRKKANEALSFANAKWKIYFDIKHEKTNL